MSYTSFLHWNYCGHKSKEFRRLFPFISAKFPADLFSMLSTTSFITCLRFPSFSWRCWVNNETLLKLGPSRQFLKSLLLSLIKTCSQNYSFLSFFSFLILQLAFLINSNLKLFQSLLSFNVVVKFDLGFRVFLLVLLSVSLDSSYDSIVGLKFVYVLLFIYQELS